MADTLDEAKLGEFMGRMAGYMTGGALCFGIWLGDELGFYQAIAEDGPQKADTLAERTRCHPRLVRECSTAKQPAVSSPTTQRPIYTN